MQRFARILSIGVFGTIALGACAGERKDATDVRGGGRPVAKLTAGAQAAAYAAAIRQEFHVNEGLMLLADSAMLPRTDGLGDGGRVPPAVLAVLARDSVVRGRCAPVRGERRAPTCESSLPGYIVRFSDIFQLAGDSARLYVRFERFQRAAATESLPPLAFENGYELVRRGGGWVVVRKGRRDRTRTGQ